MNLYTERKNQLVALMKEEGIKAVMLSPSMNMYYLTGFNTFPGERLLVSILTDAGELIFIAPKMYEQEVKEKAQFDSILAWDDSQDPCALVRRTAADKGLNNGRLAIEDTMWFNNFNKLFKSIEGASYVEASEIIGKMRMRKSKEEVDLLRNASRLADKSLQGIVKHIKPGMKETQIKELLEAEMKKNGLDMPSFDTIIGSGSNSALPHYTAGERVLQEGDSVVVDFGGVAHGYVSDMTRTFMLGKASDEYRKVYEILKAAQQKAIEAVRPGVKANSVDAAARSYIAAHGYGEYFIHRTGHGVGLEVHEMPYITDKNELILEPGMAFSIEPGIYLPGKFGMRIEDLVVVTEDGVEVLNTFSKELMEL